MKAASRTRLLACVFVACAVRFSPAATGKEIDAAADALRNELKNLVAIRDRTAGELQAPADPKATGLARFCVDDALGPHTLTINILRKDGKWTQGWATSPGWSPHTHGVELTEIVWTDTEFKAKLRVHLMYWRDRHVLHHGMSSPVIQPFGTYFNSWQSADGKTQVRDGLPIAVDCILSCRPNAKGWTWTGTLTAVRPVSARITGGALTTIGRWIPAVKPSFKPFPKVKLTLKDTAWKEYNTIADRGRLVYEQIRAMEIQQRLGLPVETALDEIARSPLTRPDPMADTDPEKGKVKLRRKGEKRKSSVPSLDDDDELGDALEDADEDPQEAARRRREQEKKKKLAVKRLGRMRAHLHAMLDTVWKWREGKHTIEIARGDAGPADRGFGPWDDPVPIPQNRDLACVLPMPVSEPGPQKWPFVNTWRVLGPFPLPWFACPSPRLPDLVPAYESLLVVDKGGFRWNHVSGHSYYGDGTSAWRIMTVYPDSGVLTPPIYTKGKYPYFGIDYGAFYAVADVIVEDACTPWAALRFKDAATVWVGNHLVWTSEDGSADVTRAGRVCRFPLPLKKGSNRVMVRVDGNARPSWVVMRICVRGCPRTPEQVARVERTRAEKLNSTGLPRDGTLGLNGDGTASFPGADPPLAWDIDSNANILWRADLPQSFSGVVLAGDRVFTTQAPFALCCVDKHTGKLLWRRNADPFELVAPPETAAKARKLVAQIDEMDSRPKPDDAARKQRNELEEELNKLYADQDGWPRENRIRQTFKRGAGLPGPTLPTPVTDGEHVWMKIGAEALACFDIEGERKWFKRIRHKGGQMGAMASSPILVGNRIFVSTPQYGKGAKTSSSISDSDKEADDREEKRDVEGAYVDHRSGRRYAVACYDAVTGERLWLTEPLEGVHFGNRYDADGIPSPVPVRLTNGSDAMDVVLLPGAGALIRADDGKVLVRRCGMRSMCPPPIAASDGTLWIIDRGLGGMRLFMYDRERVGATFLFQRGLPSRVSTYGGVVRYDGMVYFVGGGNMGYVLGFEETSGHHVVNKPLVFGRQCCGIYMPPVIAGGVLFVADNGRNGYNKFWRWKNGSLPPEERKKLIPGAMSAVLPGRDPIVLARNSMHGMVSTPVFEGNRMYIRSKLALFCIGRDDAASKRFESEQVARTILRQIPPAPPANDQDPVGPPRVHRLPAEYSPGHFAPEQIMAAWGIVGPFPGDGGAAVAELNHPANPRIFKRTKEPVTIAGVSVMPHAVSRRKLNDWPSEVLVDKLGTTPLYDLARIHAGKDNTTCLWSTILHSDRDWVLRVDLDGFAGARLWIGGVELKDGQRIRLTRGNYAIAMRTMIGDVSALPRSFRPTFWHAESREAEVKLRRARLRGTTKWLKRAVKHASDTVPGQRAAAALAWLDKS